MSAPTKRSPRRKRLAAHLYACGPRPVFEALLAVADGQPLDLVLADFGRLPAHVYRTVGAADLDTEPQLFTIRGGRRP